MDYIFFAFSSLCLSIAALLILMLISRSDRPFRWPYLLGAALIAFFYYATLVSIARESIAAYYLLNLLPQTSLLLLLILSIRRFAHKN